MRDAIRFRWALLRYEAGKRRDLLLLRLVKRMPRRLVMWALIHAGTTTIRGDEEVPAVPFMEVLRRWDC